MANSSQKIINGVCKDLKPILAKERKKEEGKSST
jgi:hypothetical protein